MACLPCGRSLHDECRAPKSVEECCCAAEAIAVDTIENETPKKKGRVKSGVGISAGRKRAAVLYPIDSKKPCDWQGLWNCGGGLFPIVGCADGMQEARHHGPIKDTEVNHRGNVHLICHTCHNRWHAVNDPHYQRDDKVAEAKYAMLPHQPRRKDGTLVSLDETSNSDESSSIPRGTGDISPDNSGSS